MNITIDFNCETHHTVKLYIRKEDDIFLTGSVYVIEGEIIVK